MQDTLLYKILIDAGGGSTKMILNFVNTENPQSSKHVQLIDKINCRAQDDYDNLATDFSNDSSNNKIWQELEYIMNRRIISVVVEVKAIVD